MIRELKEKDIMILANLRINSRDTLVNTARICNIPASTVYDRIRFLEKHFIKRYTTIIDFVKLGFNTRAKIIVKIKREEEEKLKDFLRRNNNVNSVYKINNNYDYIIEVIFRDIKELHLFLEKLEVMFDIRNYKVYHLMKDIKKEGFLQDPADFNHKEGRIRCNQ